MQLVSSTEAQDMYEIFRNDISHGTDSGEMDSIRFHNAFESHRDHSHHEMAKDSEEAVLITRAGDFLEKMVESLTIDN